MKPKVTLLLGKVRVEFLKCHEIRNCGIGTKPVCKFIVIISLLAIELKATPNGNPTNNFLLEAEI